ncbi:MAG TPA: hypothetical protein VK890_07200 [Bacteroidia bacterium]|jgi:hypothetical protein|nr:hypothetical protein [Bacteroidia bacterium]
MKKLSSAIIKKVEQKLPELRSETKEELEKWGESKLDDAFYSDAKVLKTVPYSAYEYILLAKRIKVDKPTVMDWLNAGLFDDDMLEKVIAHALRKLALKL